MEIKDCELTNQEMEEVTGGEANQKNTVMHCEACNFDLEWAGYFKKGVYYDCPKCGANEFHAVAYCP